MMSKKSRRVKIAIKEKKGYKRVQVWLCLYDHLTSDCNIIGFYRLLCITKLCVVACRCREETEINLLKPHISATV